MAFGGRFSKEVMNLNEVIRVGLNPYDLCPNKKRKFAHRHVRGKTVR